MTFFDGCESSDPYTGLQIWLFSSVALEMGGDGDPKTYGSGCGTLVVRVSANFSKLIFVATASRREFFFTVCQPGF